MHRRLGSLSRSLGVFLREIVVDRERALELFTNRFLHLAHDLLVAPDRDPAALALEHECIAFFEAELTAQLGGDNDLASLDHLGGVSRSIERFIVIGHWFVLGSQTIWRDPNPVNGSPTAGSPSG